MPLSRSAGCLANLLTWALFAAPAFAEESSGPAKLSRDQLKNGDAVLRSFRPVVQEAAKSTVRIVAASAKGADAHPRDLALATVVDAGGLVLTKASQLDKEVQCRLPGGKLVKATVVATNAEADLALLQVDAAGLTAAVWTEKTPQVGQWLATASPGEFPVAVGVVSVGLREIPKERGILGVAVTDEAAGPKVTEIIPDSGAARAGLKAGDVILEVAGKAIADGKALAERVSTYRPGTTVSLKIRREEQTVAMEAILGRRPPEGGSRGHIQNSLGGDLSLRRDGFPQALQHDTVLRPEDCGGPVVGLDGKAVGINIARGGRTESYALPWTVLGPMLKELRAQASRTTTVSAPAPTGAPDKPAPNAPAKP